MEQINLNRFENEAEEDYTYRMLGSADEWVFDVQNEEDLPEGTPRRIFNMYTEISEMSSSDLYDEMDVNERCECYRKHTLAGAWCRTWCRIAWRELERR